MTKHLHFLKREIADTERNQKKLLELKSTITGKENSLEGFKADFSRQKKKISKLEDRTIEITESE